MSEVRDRWGAGDTYEAFMGRWSRQQHRVRAGCRRRQCAWLDVGCGTGAMTNAICEQVPASVVGDSAVPFIEHARRRPGPRVSFVAAGVDSLPNRPGGFGSMPRSWR
jgi:trans-aconitate methyltransferase